MVFWILVKIRDQVFRAVLNTFHSGPAPAKDFPEN